MVYGSNRVPSFGHVDEAKMIHANLPLMEIHGSIQFKLDTNAYRMIPMANCEDYLYNRGLLQRTREVRSRWCGREVSSFQREGPEDVSLLERCPHFRGWYVHIHVLIHRQMYIWPLSKPPNFGSGMNRHGSTRSPPRRP